MHRRDVLLATAGIAAIAATRAIAAEAQAAAPPAPVAPPPPQRMPWQRPGDYKPVSPEAAALYERAIVFDANSGPAGQEEFPWPGQLLDLSRKSGVTAVKLSNGGLNSNFQDTVEELAFMQRLYDEHPDVFMPIRAVGDFARAKREKKLGILASFESVEMFEGKVERISIFRNLGVRIMQLSYNKPSLWASGVMTEPPTGLTELGRKAVAEMNKVGVAVDISHASPPSYADVLALSAKPVLATHTGCSAIHKHPRNKTDAQLRALAKKGGVVGIYDLPYLTPSPKQPTLDDYMAHMTHALKVCGEDHVGIGSDLGLVPWDTSPEGIEEFRKMTEERQRLGVAAPGEDRPMYVIGLNHNRRPETIADALLKRGYPARVAEKVIGGNFVRVLTEIW
jgi:membrane dipeptidase